MSNSNGGRIDPDVDTVLEEDVDNEPSPDILSQDTLDALNDFGDSLNSDPDLQDIDVIDDDIDQDPPVDEAAPDTAPGDGEFDDIDIRWNPDIDLSLDPAPDAGSADADASPDAQDDTSESESSEDQPSEGETGPDSSNESGQPGDETPADPDAQPTLDAESRFGRASNASDFLNSRMSMNDLVQDITARANARGAGAPHPNQGPSPAIGPAPVHQPTAGNDPGPRMSLGSAGMLLGANGIKGLAQMIGSGGRAVNSAISDYSFGNTEKALGEAIVAARSSLSEMKLGGLSVLEDEGMPDAAKRELLKQFLEAPDNKERFDTLIAKIDKMSELSGKVIHKGIERGMDGDAVMNRAIDPVHRFMKDNEAMLKNLHSGDKSLHERMEGAVTALFEMLRDVLAHLQAMFQGQPQDQRQSGPRMG